MGQFEVEDISAVSPSADKGPVTKAGLQSSRYADGNADSVLWMRGWHFAGLHPELAEVNRYRAMTLGDVPVLVQRFPEGLRAFVNVCSHRKARLQQDGGGCRPLVCPYHAWKYDSRGLPTVIPGNDRYFNIDETKAEALALKPVHLAQCGAFWFVSMEAECSLSDYLGPMWAVLEALSQLVVHRVDLDSMDWQADWKLGVESVLEIYHIPFVHQASFADFAGERWECERYGKHSSGHADLTSPAAKFWGGLIAKLGIDPLPDMGGYRHFLIFPNLSVAVTEGAYLSVQTYRPSGDCRSTCEYSLWFGGIADGSNRRSLLKAAGRELAAHNRTLLEEDREISIRVQQGVTASETPALLGQHEIRLHWFHQALSAA